MAMRTATQNGPRPLMSPSSPPSSGSDGDAETERGLVEDDRADEPARRRGDDHGERGGDEQCVADAPARTEPDDAADAGDVPAGAANTTINARPTRRVRLAPILPETQPVTSIATAVITR
jgi:hypothetical protein